MSTRSPSEIRVPCSKETRDEYLRPLKRGGETYDALLRRLATIHELFRDADERGECDECDGECCLDVPSHRRQFSGGLNTRLLP
jgi:hypothetical protein